jgi:hypothetical protein
MRLDEIARIAKESGTDQGVAIAERWQELMERFEKHWNQFLQHSPGSPISKEFNEQSRQFDEQRLEIMGELLKWYRAQK